MYDANLVLRDGSSDLTSTYTSSALELNGTPVGGLTCRVIYPGGGSGTSPTCDPKLQESDDGSSWRDLVSFPQRTDAVNAAIHVERFVTASRYIRAVLTVGGTTPNFKGVKVEVGFADKFKRN